MYGPAGLLHPYSIAGKLQRTVAPLFQEFVMGRVDDEKIGLILSEFLHEHSNAVTRIADAAGVDHLPAMIRVGSGQKFAEPAGKRDPIVVRTAVRSGSAKTKYPVRSRRLLLRKGLVVEKAQLVRRRIQELSALCVPLLNEQRNVGSETNEGIILKKHGLHTGDEQPCLKEAQEQEKREEGKQDRLP